MSWRPGSIGVRVHKAKEREKALWREQMLAQMFWRDVFARCMKFIPIKIEPK